MVNNNNNGDGKWDSVKRYKLTKMINELSSISGHGTELVTVYIPPRRPIFDVIAQLRNESGTASNIKSDLTRTHVQDALSRTIEQLKLFKETPENGLVIFCGAIPNDKGIGKEKIEIYPVIPPKPIQISLYRCDDHFWTDHLKEMMKDDKVIGILSIDTQETGIGILTGDRWEVVDTITSGVAGKHRQGGQSARRFERLRENELNEYYHRVADHVKKVFIDQYNVKGIILGGPGPTKENFLKEEYLDYRLQKSVIATIDSSYSGEEGVRELIEKAQKDGILQEYRVMEEKQLVKKFMSEVHSGRGLGIYGVHDVVRALEGGVADLVIVTDDISHVRLEFKCKACKNVQTKIVERAQVIATKQEYLTKPCPSCHATDIEPVEKDIVDYLNELATMTGARLEVISSKTEEGSQLASLGKIGAILRYKPM
ncbi:peptide chain release factor subunit 1 [Candidatus Nitrososphaera gargensis Ga9.2]|uniref:Peptide chain release factor subunit 1 n=1 Tax=Nitrososphaera gargensis (strain Ga9.2) TaxID=1237085 RepID=K0IK10_NITGG|nr:peptide chain release factor aRF-1 [Candidatus Nitrososphaera gargensis]AFU58622.1 peptide chain release factor subunit 1 [Candidatus Nitrososphaera gargensis Ga9.2]